MNRKIRPESSLREFEMFEEGRRIEEVNVLCWLETLNFWVLRSVKNH